MALPKFSTVKPDLQHFMLVPTDDMRVKNRARAGRSWTDEEKTTARRAALDGVPVNDCCEMLGRPFSSVAQYYQQAGILFRDAHYRFWMRVPTKDFPTPVASIGDTPMKTIETKTFIAGQDASKMSDTQIFRQIASLEADIVKLEAIKAKPKKLLAVIDQANADIAALVKYVDERDTVTDTPAPAIPPDGITR